MEQESSSANHIKKLRNAKARSDNAFAYHEGIFDGPVEDDILNFVNFASKNMMLSNIKKLELLYLYQREIKNDIDMFNSAVELGYGKDGKMHIIRIKNLRNFYVFINWKAGLEAELGLTKALNGLAMKQAGKLGTSYTENVADMKDADSVPENNNTLFGLFQKNNGPKKDETVE